jgi:competence ComEA-like helix-hairpin-helix protein
MTSSETRALRHAALLVLGLGLLRTAVGVRGPVTTQGTVPPDSAGLAQLLDTSRESRDEGRRRALPLTGDERIDPNTAGEEDLDRLPGVGPALAERIVRTRQDRGPFAEPADLLSVPGVGPATLARITPYLELSSRPRLSRSARPPRPARDPPAAKPRPLDLNRASREELERLPGVGPVIAERILTRRREMGRFRTLEDLQSVRGIGSATIERLRPFAIVGG